MAYKHDKDLEFLRKMKDEELHTLVEILIRDKDGALRKAEELTGKEGYKRYGRQYGRYIDDILEEVQTFGGDTLINIFRRGGVLYREILNDVCKRCEVEVRQNESVESSESRLTQKLLKDALDKADEATLRQVAQEVGYDFTKLKDLGGKLTSEVLLKFITGGNLSAYKISSIVASLALAQFLPKVAGAVGLGTLASFGLGRVAGILNPLLAVGSIAWLASEITGPAYRVTIPATLQVALLRQLYLNREAIEKEYKENKRKHEKAVSDIESEINDNEQLNEEEKWQKVLEKITKYFAQIIKLNILIVGATGVGKSSTIQALFKDVRDRDGNPIKINHTRPETQEINYYTSGKHKGIILWDSPGLGEGKEADERHKKLIAEKLQEKDENGNALIDAVLVILDAANRDMGTSYELIEHIVNNMATEDKNRIIIALNKCDNIGGDRGEYIEHSHKPSPLQEELLRAKVEDIKMRVAKDTGVDVEPIYYTAGILKEGDTIPKQSYNLSKLLAHIVKSTPPKKRVVFLNSVNDDKGGNEGDKDYKKSWLELAIESVRKFYNNNKEAIDSMVEKGKEMFFSWLNGKLKPFK